MEILELKSKVTERKKKITEWVSQKSLSAKEVPGQLSQENTTLDLWGCEFEPHSGNRSYLK